VLINGVKYACERCIRGHRVSACTHTDQPLVMIKPKGRPSSQCAFCREQRKLRNHHAKCTCGKKTNTKMKYHENGCACSNDVGTVKLEGHCTCCHPKKKKSPPEKEKLDEQDKTKNPGHKLKTDTKNGDDLFLEQQPINSELVSWDMGLSPSVSTSIMEYPSSTNLLAQVEKSMSSGSAVSGPRQVGMEQLDNFHRVGDDTKHAGEISVPLTEYTQPLLSMDQNLNHLLRDRKLDDALSSASREASRSASRASRRAGDNEETPNTYQNIPYPFSSGGLLEMLNEEKSYKSEIHSSRTASKQQQYPLQPQSTWNSGGNTSTNTNGAASFGPEEVFPLYPLIGPGGTPDYEPYTSPPSNLQANLTGSSHISSKSGTYSSHAPHHHGHHHHHHLMHQFTPYSAPKPANSIHSSSSSVSIGAQVPGSVSPSLSSQRSFRSMDSTDSLVGFQLNNTKTNATLTRLDEEFGDMPMMKPVATVVMDDILAGPSNIGENGNLPGNNETGTLSEEQPDDFFFGLDMGVPLNR